MTDTADARKHFAVIRARRRNLRLGRYQGRNNGGDCAQRIVLAASAARAAGRELEGLIWAEHRLAERVSENRDAGNDRPELRARLANYRRQIKEQEATR